MKTDSITVAELADLAELTPRRVQQLIADGVLPPEISKGKLPFRDAIKAVIGYYRRADSGSIGREKLLLLQAKRKLAEQKLRDAVGGDLVPTGVITQAAEMAVSQFRNLASNLYSCGIAEARQGGTWNPTIERIGTDFADAFLGSIRQWTERQAQIQKEKQCGLPADER